MKKGIWPTTIRGLAIAAAAVALLALGIACGDDDGGSDPEAYFQEIETLFQDTDARFDEVDEAFSAEIGDAATEEEGVDITKEYLGDLQAVIEDALDKLNAIDPPNDAIGGIQEEFATAVEDLLAIIEGLRSDLESAETQEEIEAVFTAFDEEGTAASDRADQSCMDLQEAAAAIDITIDLNCEEDSTEPRQ